MTDAPRKLDPARSPIAALLTELSSELDGWSDSEAQMVLAVTDGWEPDPATVLWCKQKLEAAIDAQCAEWGAMHICATCDAAELVEDMILELKGTP